MDVTAELSRLGIRHGQGDLSASWAERRPLNTPGPLYSGDADNSGPGPAEAPNDVFVDEEGFPFVFRQPTITFELRQVLVAAHNDPFRGYGADGDRHWNYSLVREWWQSRHDIDAKITDWRARHLQAARTSVWYLAGLDRWHDYLRNGLAQYLRIYTFFLEEGRVPEPGESLPDFQWP